MRVILLLALASAPYVFFETFSGLQGFDDEGTLMIVFRDIIDGRVLYDDIFALYGPFYYMILTPLFDFFQVPLTHDSARITCAVFRLCCSVALASFAYMITRSKPVGAFVMLATVVLLKPLVSSPLHPQEIGFLLVAILLHLVVRLENDPKPQILVFIGAVVGGLMLTKINLGVFVAVPIGLAAMRVSGDYAVLRVGHAILLGASVLIPMGLMVPLFQFPWVINYCLFSTATILAALVIWVDARLPQIMSVSDWGYVVVGILAVTLVTIGTTLASGTTFYELFNAVVLQSADIAMNWNLPMHLGVIASVSSTITLGAALLCVFCSRHRTMKNHVPFAIFCTKAVIALVGLIAIASLFQASWVVLAKFMFQALLPFAWLLAIPPASENSPRTLTRSVLATLAAFLVLYAYPVAGGQIVLSALLPTVMLPILFHDVVKDIPLYFGSKELALPAWLTSASARSRFAAFVYFLVTVLLINQTAMAVRQYRSMKALSLTGSALVRAEAETVDNYQWAVTELSKCESFYTFPGLPSLYFWTGQRSPTGFNSANPLGLLTDSQQNRVTSELGKFTGMCILTYPNLQYFYDRGQMSVRPPIIRYIEKNFLEIDSKGPFRLLRRRSVN